MSKKNKKKTKRKLNKRRFSIFIIILLFFAFFIYYIFNIRIKNIYISGNDFLTDQEIIDIAELKDYPNSLNNLSQAVKNRLKKSKYIIDATVKKKKMLSSIYIDIKENYPLFYYQVENKTILCNGDKVDKSYSVPTVINQIPDTVYKEFIECMGNVKKDILNRISEIEYLPNEVDEERFLLIMNDGNYVYLTLNKFLTLNKYLDMIKSFENKKGILYLDSGEYFDVFDN